MKGEHSFSGAAAAGRPGTRKGETGAVPLYGYCGPAGVPAEPPAMQNAPSQVLPLVVGAGCPERSGVFAGAGTDWSTAASAGMAARGCCNTLPSDWMAASLEACICLSSPGSAAAPPLSPLLAAVGPPSWPASLPGQGPGHGETSGTKPGSASGIPRPPKGAPTLSG